MSLGRRATRLAGPTARAAARRVLRSRPPHGPPVLVTGNGRSGTSWVGGTLGRAPGVAYYREPCHPGLHGATGERADEVWGRYVPPEGHDDYFARCLDDAFAGVPGPGGAGLRSLPHRLRKPPRVVVKEVASFASLEWVWRTWSPQVLVLVRHPCAYVASVLEMGQHADEVRRFRTLRADAALRSRFDAGLLAHMDAVDDPLAAAAAGWAVRNLLTLAHLDERPAWRLVRYEELAADPVEGFARIFAWCGLELDAALSDWIRERSTVSREGRFATSRVSSSRIDAWRSELNPWQVLRVREVLEPFGLPVYGSAAEW